MNNYDDNHHNSTYDPRKNYNGFKRRPFYGPDSDISNSDREIYETVSSFDIFHREGVVEKELQQLITTGDRRKLIDIKRLIIESSRLSPECYLLKACHALSCNWIEAAKLILWNTNINVESYDYFSARRSEALSANPVKGKRSLSFKRDVLFLAVKKEEVMVVRLILSEGLNVNSKVMGPFTSIHVAVQRQYVPIVECLLTYGANVNSQYPIANGCYNGRTLLQRAVMHGNMALIRLLIFYGANVNAARKDGGTALHEAAQKGSVEIAKYLIEEGADVNPKIVPFSEEDGVRRTRSEREDGLLECYGVSFFDRNAGQTSKPLKRMEGCTPLMVAIQNNHEEIVELFLENGADINVRGGNGVTTLQLAIQTGRPKIVSNILDRGPDGNDKNNKESLYSVVRSMGTRDDTIVLNKLLQYGFTLDPVDLKNPELLRYAVRGEFLQIVKLLLDSGADPNRNCYTWNEYNQSPLHIAVIRGNEAMVRLLLEFGAEPNATDEDGHAPLTYACVLSQSEIARVLLRSGAEILSKRLAMIFAAANCDAKLVRIFIENGLGINDRIHKKELRYKNLRALYNVKIGRVATHYRRFECLLDFLPKAFPKVTEGQRRKFYESCEVTPLSISARAGQIETVKLLLAKCADIHSANEEGVTALHEAAFGGHLAIVKLLVEFGANFDAKSEQGTPLYGSVGNGKWEVVEYLLKSRANYKRQRILWQADCIFYDAIIGSNAPDNIVKALVEYNAQYNETDIGAYTTSVQHLIKNKKLELVKLLVNYATNFSWENQERMILKCITTAAEEDLEEHIYFLLNYSLRKFKSVSEYGAPLLISVEKGNLEVVKAFLRSGASVNSVDSKEQTALHIAAKEDYVGIVQALLEYGASVNLRDQRGRSPLFNASEKGHIDIVQLLLGDEIDSDTENDDGRSKAYSTFKGYYKLARSVKTRTRFRAVVDARDRRKKTPLFKASKNGHYRVVKYLLTNGASANNKTVHFQTPMSIAARKGHLNTITILTKFGALVNTRDKFGKSPLYNAVGKGHLDVVLFLLKNGANTETINIYSEITPLFRSVEKNYLKISEELMKAGAQVNVMNVDRKSPLHYAVMKNSDKMVALLIEYGADVNFQDPDGLTPLIIATKEDSRERIFETLLRAGADTQLQDSNGKTALHHAAESHRNKLVQELLEAGADLSAKDSTGKTPLFGAVATGKIQNIETLIEAGADINATDEDGKTALTAALRTSDISASIKLLLAFDAAVDVQQLIREFEQILYCTRTYKNIDTTMYYATAMKAANMQLGVEIIEAYDKKYHKCLDEFYEKCTTEVYEMVNDCVGNTGTTFYEILTMDVDHLKAFINNEDAHEIIQTDHEIKRKFPIYADTIRIRLRLGKIRKTLLEQGVNSCWYLFYPYATLPDDVIEKVLSYVSNEDLRVLIVTCKPIKASILGKCSSLEDLDLFDN